MITDSFLLSLELELGEESRMTEEAFRGSTENCAKERTSIGETWLQERRKLQKIFIYLVSPLPYGQAADYSPRLCSLPSSLFFPHSLFYGQNFLKCAVVTRPSAVYNHSFFLPSQSVSLNCSLCLWQKYIDNSIWNLLSEQCYQITATYDTFLHVLTCLF